MSKIISVCSIMVFFCFSGSLKAIDDPSFDISTSILSMNKLYINGVKSFEKVKIKFNFENSTFQVTSANQADNSIPEKPIKTVTTEGITVGLKGCNSINKVVTCYLLVTSNEFDSKLEFCATNGFDCFESTTSARNSTASDDLNNSYNASKLTLANKEGDTFISNVSLVADIATEATVQFSNISTRATSFSLIVLAFAKNRQAFKVEFRNISF